MLDEDFEAWELFPHHRWVFNKLEVAMKLKYRCGPACVPVRFNGEYIIRPIYNLYGMSVGAYKDYLYSANHKEMENHAFIPPGYFWCEWFNGPHYSIDYKWADEGKGGVHSHWAPICTTVGTKDGLKFTDWEKVDNVYKKLPDWIYDFEDVDWLNIEFIGNKLVEIHLRTGNDIVHEDPIGTRMIPHWTNDDMTEIDKLQEEGWTYYKNYGGDGAYDASGYINNPRMGYLKKWPE